MATKLPPSLRLVAGDEIKLPPSLKLVKEEPVLPSSLKLAQEEPEGIKSPYLESLKFGLAKSTPALLTQLATGEAPIQAEKGFEPKGIAQKTISLISEYAPDTPLFLLGGGLGGVAVKAFGKKLAGQTLKTILEKQGASGTIGALSKVFERRGAKGLADIVTAPALRSAITGAGAFGVAEAAKEATTQAVETGEIRPGAVLAQAGKQALIGGLLSPPLEAAGRLAGRAIFGVPKPKKLISGEISPELKKVASDAGVDLRGPKVSLIEPKKIPETIKEAETLSGTYLSEAGQQFTPGQRQVTQDLFKVGAQDIAAQRRYSISNAEIDRLSKNVDIKIQNEKIFIKGKEVLPGTTLEAEALDKFGQMRRSLVNDLADVTDMLQKAPTEVLQKRYDDLFQTALLFENKWYGVRAETGRALNSLKKLKTPSDSFESEISKTLKTISSEEKSLFQSDILRARSLVQKNLNSGLSPDKAYKPLIETIQKFSNETWTNKFIEFTVLSKLLNPVTQLRNIIGNTSFLGTRITEKFINAGIDLPASLIRGKREAFFGEGAAEIFGVMTSFRKSMAKAIPALLDDTSANFLKGQEVLIYRPAIKGTFGSVLRTLTSRPLAAMDIFFRSLSQESIKNAEIYKKIAKEGLSPISQYDKFAQRFKDLALNLPEDIVTKVEEESTRRVFQTPLTGMTQSIEMFRRRHPISRLVFPFLRTPMNIFMEGVKRTPLAPILPSIRADLRAGGDRAIDALGSMVFGTSVSAYVGMSAISEKLDIVGPIPKEPGDRSLFFAEGKQPFSIKIDDKWYSYRGLEPFSTLLANAALLSDALKQKDIKTYDEIAGQMTRDAIQYSKDQTFMQGLSELVKFIENADESSIKSSFLGFLAKGALIPTGIQQIARAASPELRFAQTPLEQIQSGIPGLAKRLPKRLDIFGQPIAIKGIPEAPTAMGRVAKLYTPKGLFEALFRPSPASKDQTVQELARLNKETGLRLSPVSPFYAGVRMTPEEINQIQSATGQALKNALDEIMVGERYRALSDIDKKDLIKNIETQFRKQYREETHFKFRVLIRAIEDRKTQDGKFKLIEKLKRSKSITQEDADILNKKYSQ